jgi:hypothetical protein
LDNANKGSILGSSSSHSLRFKKTCASCGKEIDEDYTNVRIVEVIHLNEAGETAHNLRLNTSFCYYLIILNK